MEFLVTYQLIEWVILFDKGEKFIKCDILLEFEVRSVFLLI